MNDVEAADVHSSAPMKRSLPFLLLIVLMEMTAALKTALSVTKKMAATEVSFLCSDGMKLAGQRFSSGSNNKSPQHRILCLHGWLDNCRSFYQLAPSLVLNTNTAEVVTLDFPGHGWSDHKSADGGAPSVMAEYVFYVREVVQKLQWNDSIVLVGHSMGAAVSLMYAAAFPEQVSKLVLLEGAGPLTRSARDVAQHIRNAVEKRQAGNVLLFPEYSNGTTMKKKKEPRSYPNIDLAVETRCKTAALSPGNQYLSTEASRAMVERATVNTNGDGAAVQFRHDVRLQWPSLSYMTDEQVVEGLYKDVECPVCLLLAEDGWPVDSRRKEAVVQKLQPTVLKVLPGSHHFHADPETSDEVAQEVKAFIFGEQQDSSG